MFATGASQLEAPSPTLAPAQAPETAPEIETEAEAAAPRTRSLLLERVGLAKRGD